MKQIIRITDLVWYPVSGQKLFEGLSLSVDENTFLFIEAGNCTGKTSFFRLLLGFHKPHSGSILIDGRNPARLTPKFLARHRRRVQLITSEDQFFSRSVLENVSLPLEIRGVAKVRASKRASLILDKLSLSNLSAKNPSECSTSERRMISLARLLVTHPSIVLADEPFSGLDTPNRVMMIEQLIQLHQRGATIIVATRSAEEFGFEGTKTMTLSDGVIKEQGEFFV